MAPNIDDWFPQFHAYVKLNRPGSSKFIPNHVRRFTVFYEEAKERGERLDQIPILFIQSIENVSYRKGARDSVVYFWRWAQTYSEELTRAYFPVNWVAPPYVKQPAPKAVPYLDPLQMRRILDWAEVEESRVLFTCVMLAYSHGLRMGEVLNLQIRDVVLNTQRPHIYVREGKGAQTRVVPFIEPWSLRKMHEYGDIREKISGLWTSKMKSSDWLFVTHDDRQYKNRKELDAFIVKCYARLGIPAPELPFHSLRNTFMRHLRLSAEGKGRADLDVIKLLVGHKNIAQTEAYCQMPVETLVTMQDRFHPLALLEDERLAGLGIAGEVKR